MAGPWTSLGLLAVYVVYVTWRVWLLHRTCQVCGQRMRRFGLVCDDCQAKMPASWTKM